jgi:DNA-3-methyladenine glycosylase
VSSSRKPPRTFFLQPTLTVARALIGMHLVHAHGGRLQRARIVETEAYLGPKDLAAHSARGHTPRTSVMYGPPGHAYVYFIYGFWNCLNVVTSAPGIPHAVLLRALEPVAAVSERTSGPGLLCRALGIDRRLNGADLLGQVLWLERAPRGAPRARITRATRIGVEYAGSWAAKPWRFYDAASPYVSTLTAAERRRLLALQEREAGPRR